VQRDVNIRWATVPQNRSRMIERSVCNLGRDQVREGRLITRVIKEDRVERWEWNERRERRYVAESSMESIESRSSPTIL